MKEDKRCEGTLRIHSPRKAILEHVDVGDGNSSTQQSRHEDHIDVNKEIIGME